MSIWTRIGDALTAMSRGEPLSAVFDRLRTPPEHSVAFTIAVIALGAKMAKADGRVTRGEVAAFREVFHIPPADEAAAARVFDLARQDVAGFEAYAARVARMFGAPRDPGEEGPLGDLLEGLFHIALADGDYKPEENAFLRRVASIFGLSDTTFRTIRARLVPGVEPDPYDVLGIPAGSDSATAHAAWKREVRACHPDRLAARGLPEEAVRMAEHRLAKLNRAWEAIEARPRV